MEFAIYIYTLLPLGGSIITLFVVILILELSAIEMDSFDDDIQESDNSDVAIRRRSARAWLKMNYGNQKGE